MSESKIKSIFDHLRSNVRRKVCIVNFHVIFKWNLPVHAFKPMIFIIIYHSCSFCDFPLYLPLSDPVHISFFFL